VVYGSTYVQCESASGRRNNVITMRIEICEWNDIGCSVQCESFFSRHMNVVITRLSMSSFLIYIFYLKELKYV
jgi:hypothetical protein